MPEGSARIYPGGDRRVSVSPADVARGFVEVECPACEGTGEFVITDDHSQPCVRCSSRGQVVVSI